jgi:hypothetical protein
MWHGAILVIPMCTLDLENMIPVNQTILHTETTKGNCLAANIASILDIATVPNFAESRYWERDLNQWLADNHKLYYLELPITEHNKWVVEQSEIHHLIHGPSPRGEFWHSVVGKRGVMVHDPHPDKTGLKEEKTYVFLVHI